MSWLTPCFPQNGFLAEYCFKTWPLPVGFCCSFRLSWILFTGHFVHQRNTARSHRFACPSSLKDTVQNVDLLICLLLWSLQKLKFSIELQEFRKMSDNWEQLGGYRDSGVKGGNFPLNCFLLIPRIRSFHKLVYKFHERHRHDSTVYAIQRHLRGIKPSKTCRKLKLYGTQEILRLGHY